MLEARNDMNVEQRAWDYNRLYIEELELAFIGAVLRSQMTNLHNEELMFENQRTLARRTHMMERMMSRRNRCQGGTSILTPSTWMRLPLQSNLDVSTLPWQNYHLYNHAVSYQSQRIVPLEDDDNASSGRRH
ncbi:hypothetical protein Syun_006511 [Stephania yunnanensis]|uniref:Uncharacterized protein n=1 Tax=Stephania yunnanensis TaxID=152371 RepID=A0AAP0KZC7_9MAGN